MRCSVGEKSRAISNGKLRRNLAIDLLCIAAFRRALPFPARQRGNSRSDACRLRNPAHLICQSRSWLGGPNNALKSAQYLPKQGNAESAEDIFKRYLLAQRDQEEEISTCLRKSTLRVLSRLSSQ